MPSRSDLLAASALVLYVVALAYAVSRMMAGALGWSLVGFLAALVIVLGAHQLIRLEGR